MAFNIVSVGATDAEREELLAGVGKCRAPLGARAVVASPIPERAEIVPVKTPAPYGSRFPYNKSKEAGEAGDEC